LATGAVGALFNKQVRLRRRRRRRPLIRPRHLGRVIKSLTLASAWTVWTRSRHQRKSHVRLKIGVSARDGAIRKNIKTSRGKLGNASGMLAQHVLNVQRLSRRLRQRLAKCAVKAATGGSTSRKKHAKERNARIVANALVSVSRNAGHPGPKNVWTSAIARRRVTERSVTKMI
jgi:hypothetical protein